MRVYGEPLIQHLDARRDRVLQQGLGLCGAPRDVARPSATSSTRIRSGPGLASGSLQVVATDHCAFTTEQKRDRRRRLHQDPERHRRPRGPHAGAVDARASSTGRLTMNEFVAVTSTNIAKILNIYPQEGRDRWSAPMPTSSSGIRRRRRRSRAKTQQSVIDYNVFEGFEVTGLPRFTLSRGEVVCRRRQDRRRGRPRPVRRAASRTPRSTRRCRRGRS